MAASIRVTQFAMVRFGLGIGEAGNFPAGIKAVTEWFPAKERAFAIGIFNAGANIGAIVTPLVVPFLVVAYGWRAAFVITGVVTFVWLVVWLAIYRRPREQKRVSAAELAYIEQDPADPGDAAALGAASRPRARPGPMRSASSASIRSGGSSCSGCPASSAKRYGLDILPVRPAAGRHLSALRHRLDRRRLGLVAADQGAAGASITRAR